jgi:hypothetical protein
LTQYFSFDMKIRTILMSLQRTPFRALISRAVELPRGAAIVLGMLDVASLRAICAFLIWLAMLLQRQPAPVRRCSVTCSPSTSLLLFQ